MTAPELMDTAEVRKVAISRFGGDIQTTINKLSDTLGFMWRRGVVVRYPLSVCLTEFTGALCLRLERKN